MLHGTVAQTGRRGRGCLPSGGRISLGARPSVRVRAARCTAATAVSGRASRGEMEKRCGGGAARARCTAGYVVDGRGGDAVGEDERERVEEADTKPGRFHGGFRFGGLPPVPLPVSRACPD